MAKQRHNQRCKLPAVQPEVKLPERMKVPEGRRLVSVLVEGYEDVAFWRGIFDEYESRDITFEISVPTRDDLAKGKKTLLSQAEKCNDNLILCMDSDFDYLFADQTAQARIVNSSPHMFHTYAYATENYVCYAPSLHNICVKATKNDIHIFDFERFFADYSRTIYQAFLWYAFSAQISAPNIFSLMNFKNTVRLGYLDIERNGADTIAWLSRQVSRRILSLETEHPEVAEKIGGFERMLRSRGVTPENTYLFMHGHTLMDNVTVVVLDAVCSKLKLLVADRIKNSVREGVALVNEQSNYTNSLYNVRDALLFNENYKSCFLYKKLQSDIETFISTTTKCK